MKKAFFIFFTIFILSVGYIIYDEYIRDDVPKLVIEEDAINVSELYIYGNHFNLHGSIPKNGDFDLVLYNGDFLEYQINISDLFFNLSNYINDGINLETIPRGYYYVLLREKVPNKDGNAIYRYYRINNNTEYMETSYYTFSNINNKIIIDTENKVYNTLAINVSANRDRDIYDVVVDAGHGGRDSGASKYGYDEADFTMMLAISLKEKLESFGIKVKLTREKNQLTDTDKLNDYGRHGRAIIGHEVHAKYLFSLHMNSSSNTNMNGLEVYTANNINYDFAKKLALNIKKNTGINYSFNPVNEVYDGVYTRMFTQGEVNKSLQEYEEDGLVPYDVTTKSNYYFMIREPGAIITGAYVDDRNSIVNPGNPYINSNVGVESYLLELGYISNRDDLDRMINNTDKYTEAIAWSFKDLFYYNGVRQD